MMRSRPALTMTLVAVFVILRGSAALPAEAAPDSFIDDDNSRFEPFIETAREHDLISGCNPPENDRACPHRVVTRGTMAIMLARAVGAPASDGDHFTDDDGHIAEGAIEALIGHGVSMGCEIDRFCPDRPITRGEMAALIARALAWEQNADPARYADIADSAFARPLAELAARGALEACDAPVNTELCPRRIVRRDEAAFSLVSALGLSPVSTSPRGPDLAEIGFGDSFDRLSLWDGRTPSYRNRVQLTDNGFRDSALRVTIPKGSHFGADFKLDLDKTVGDEPDRLYFRYFLQLDRGWSTSSSGKLPGFSGVYGASGKGGYRSRPGDPGWSARLMFSPTTDTEPRARIGYYVYHLGQERRYGDGLRWNEAGKLVPGEWYCLEGEVEMNTPGLADGALRAWVDGTPAFDQAGLEFRRPNEPEIHIESFWFNVYYGGKALPDQNLGMTIDEVVVDTSRIGCQAGEGTTGQGFGDFDGNGYEDRVWWSNCPGGNCFWLQTTASSGATTTRQVGKGAWFSLETHRLGLSTGDVDGDGRADVVYRGRCTGSVRCWRVHELSGERLGPGQNWGDGARFSAATESLILGDWDGDGLDDLTYQGTCGDEPRSCWRLHRSTGGGFDDPLDWGRTPAHAIAPVAADITGDGRDDLVYRDDCAHSTCWYVQESTGSSFAAPRALGRATAAELRTFQMADFDDDGAVDVVSWDTRGDRSRIWVRLAGPAGLANPVVVAEVNGEVREVLLRRLVPGSPVQALVQVDCPAGDPCVEYLVGTSPGRLSNPSKTRVPVREWLGVPSIV